MKKQKYEAPMIQKVSLDVNTAVLAVCHSSTIFDSATHAGGCRLIGNCFAGAPLSGN